MSLDDFDDGLPMPVSAPAPPAGPAGSVSARLVLRAAAHQSRRQAPAGSCRTAPAAPPAPQLRRSSPPHATRTRARRAGARTPAAPATRYCMVCDQTY